MSCSRRCAALSLAIGEVCDYLRAFARAGSKCNRGVAEPRRMNAEQKLHRYAPRIFSAAPCLRGCILEFDGHNNCMSKKRLLTGDTPTGKLHIGHYVGSIENRLALQNEYECFFLIANKHA